MRARSRLAAVTLAVLVIAGLVLWRVVDRPDPEPTSSSGSRSDAAPLPERAGSLAAAPRIRSDDAAHGQPPADHRLWLAETVVVVGRVVDEGHRPIEGADVFSRVAGLEEARGRTAVDGRFRLAVGTPPTPYVLVAIRAANRGFAAARGLVADLRRDAVADAGDLVLRPAEDLVVRVLDRGQPVDGARVWASSRNPLDPYPFRGSPNGTWLGWPYAGTTDASGTVRLEAVALGDVRVLALAEGPRRGEAQRRHPAGHGIEVALERARDVAVEVVERDDDERPAAPVSGVRIGVETASETAPTFGEDLVDDPQAPAPTGAAGKTILRALPRDPFFALTVLGDGWIYPRWRSGVALRPGEESLRIEIPTASHSARLAATFADGPAPADGTVVAVEPNHDERGWYGDAGVPAVRARVEHGELVIDGLRLEQLSALARLPDGRIARFTTRGAGREVPPAFSRPRSAEVLVREEDGSPAHGVVVNLTQKGGRRLVQGVALDESGRCVIGDLPPQALGVAVETNPDLVSPSFRYGVFATESAEMDLRSGDGHAEVVVPPVVDAVVSVSVEGQPGFPAGLDLMAEAWPAGLEAVSPRNTVWDAQRGEVRFRTRHRDNRSILATLTAPGRERCVAKLEWDEKRRGLFGSVDFSPTGSVVARVIDSTAVPAEWVLERRTDSGEWDARVGYHERMGDGRREHRLEGVPVGHFRLRELRTGLCSDEADVVAGGLATLTLDGSLAWKVSVDVEVPPGTDVEKLTLRRSGDGLVIPSGTWGVQASGWTHVEWTMPGDRPVRIVAHHPDLVGVGGEDAAVLERPVSDVRLRLVAPR